MPAVTTSSPITAAQACGEPNVLRPHVVWFGEMPLALDAIYAALARCDLFMAIGTSGQVYPAAGFVEAAGRHGRARTLELNLEPSAVNSLFEEHRRGPASATVPRLVEEILGQAQRVLIAALGEACLLLGAASV